MASFGVKSSFSDSMPLTPPMRICTAPGTVLRDKAFCIARATSIPITPHPSKNAYPSRAISVEKAASMYDQASAANTRHTLDPARGELTRNRHYPVLGKPNDRRRLRERQPDAISHLGDGHVPEVPQRREEPIPRHLQVWLAGARSPAVFREEPGSTRAFDSNETKANARENMIRAPQANSGISPYFHVDPDALVEQEPVPTAAQNGLRPYPARQLPARVDEAVRHPAEPVPHVPAALPQRPPAGWL